MILYQGPVTGPEYTLARALVGPIVAKFDSLWPSPHAWLQYVWSRVGKTWVLRIKNIWKNGLNRRASVFQFFNAFQDILSNFSRWFPIFQVSQHDFVSGSCNRPCIYAGSSRGRANCCKISFSLTITACMVTICLKQSGKNLSAQDHKYMKEWTW